jgi:hypothetical protein
MRAINHALTGTVIGFAISEPAIAIPLSLVSHYICDAIPHFGSGISEKHALESKSFERLLYVDTVLCILLVIVLAIIKPQHWAIAAFCAFVAASPDFLSFNRWQKMRVGIKSKLTPYGKFAKGIQWFERPIGAFVEIAWAIAAIILIVPFLKV